MKLRYFGLGLLLIGVVVLLLLGDGQRATANAVATPVGTPTSTRVSSEAAQAVEVDYFVYMPLAVNEKQVNILHPVEGGVYNPAIGLQVQVMPYCAWYFVTLKGDNYLGTKVVPWDAWLVLPHTPVSIASDYEFVPAGEYSVKVYCEDLDGTVLYGPKSVNFTLAEDLVPLPTPTPIPPDWGPTPTATPTAIPPKPEP